MTELTKQKPSLPAEAVGRVSSETGLTARGLATRRKLLDGGRAAFVERGYERTRVSDITDYAGVSLGNFYRHFDDKDAILLAILKPLYDELRTSTGRGTSAAPVSSVGILARRNAAYLTFYAAHRGLFRVSREAAASSQSSTFREMWFEMRGEFIARNKAWLASLVRTGKVSPDIDTTLMADALGSMNEQLAYTRIALAEDAPGPEKIEAMSRTLAQIWWNAIFQGAA